MDPTASSTPTKKKPKSSLTLLNSTAKKIYINKHIVVERVCQLRRISQRIQKKTIAAIISLATVMMSLAHFPRIWKEAEVVLIEKPAKENEFPN